MSALAYHYFEKRTPEVELVVPLENKNLVTEIRAAMDVRFEKINKRELIMDVPLSAETVRTVQSLALKLGLKTTIIIGDRSIEKIKLFTA